MTVISTSENCNAGVVYVDSMGLEARIRFWDGFILIERSEMSWARHSYNNMDVEWRWGLGMDVDVDCDCGKVGQ